MRVRARFDPQANYIKRIKEAVASGKLAPPILYHKKFYEDGIATRDDREAERTEQTTRYAKALAKLAFAKEEMASLKKELSSLSPPAVKNALTTPLMLIIAMELAIVINDLESEDRASIGT